MFLNRIQTFGYRANDLDIPLAPLTGVFGENETGKSQVIDAIRLLLEGSAPDATLIRQVNTVGGIMRYARDPRDGIRIVGVFGEGQTVVRSWVADARGAVTQTITQDLADVSGLKGQEALLAGLLPEAALWDVRAIVNQSGEKGRNALLSLFASRGQQAAMKVCPDDAPDWALPNGEHEPAATWIMRALARCRENLKVAAGEAKEAQRRITSLEDAWRVPDAPTAEELEAQAEVVGFGRELVSRRQAAGALRSTLARGRPPAVDQAAVLAASQDEKQAELDEDTARATIERARQARTDLNARVKEAAAYLRSQRTVPATKGCEKCGHGAKPASTTPLDPAKKLAAEACIANAENEGAILLSREEGAAADLQSAMKRRLDARQRGLELDKQASALDEFDRLNMALQLEEAELEEVETFVDLEVEQAKLAKMRQAFDAAAQARAKLGLRDEARKDLRDAEESVAKYEKIEAWMVKLQSKVLDDLRAAIEKPLSAMVGRPVEVSLEDLKGNPDLRWMVGGVDAAAVNDASAFAFLVGMKLALAPLSNARFKLLTADRFESVSKERRVPFLSRLKQALDAGVIHQAIVCGCPDTIPHVEGMKAVML